MWRLRSSQLPAFVVIVFTLPTAPAEAEMPGAMLVLESLSATLPGQIPEAAPPRFVLLADGRVFVGGTSRAAAGHLDGKQIKALEAKLTRVRKQLGAGVSVTLGPGDQRRRLVLPKAAPMIVLGDPAAAPPNLKQLATLVDELERFDHPSLRPYEPTSYALRARAGKLVGGCRSWALPVSLEEALSAPRLVPAAAAHGWPTGASPASVCHGNATYIVTLRPLLPGERP